MDDSMSAAVRWEQAESTDAYVARTVANHELWTMMLKRATLSDADAERAARSAGTWRVLILAEDWCGDAVNSVPVLQRWGARPAPLQQWVLAHGMQMEKEARYKEVRTWYARDRGRTIAHEFMTALEEADGRYLAGSNAA